MSDIPEIPPPHRPDPGRPEPGWSPQPSVPMVELPDPWLDRRLHERRTLLLSGPLDRDAATRLCAQLMTLDGESADHVRVFVNSDGGPLDDVLAVLDVIELMRAEVDVTCVGAARGTAAALLACASGQRRAAPSATISLRCAHPDSVDGSAEDLRRRAQELDTAWAHLRQLLVRATGRPVEEVEEQLSRGELLDARQAEALRIVDGLAVRSPGAI